MADPEVLKGPEQIRAEKDARARARWSQPLSGSRKPFQPEQLTLPGVDATRGPLHSLNKEQFAAQPEVWWHGRYSEDLPQDSYKEHSEVSPDTSPDYYDEETGEWESDTDSDKSGYYGIHLGTRKAAIDRLKAHGPGRSQGYDDNSGHDVPWNPGEKRHPGRLFPAMITGRMGGGIGPDLGSDWRPLMGYEEPSKTGAIYQNLVEDPGSYSATVPTREHIKTWNDIVTDADARGEYVHPTVLHAAQFGPEHTGEDIMHPSDEKKMASLTPEDHPGQGALFRLYSGGGRTPIIPHRLAVSEALQVPIATNQSKYLDEHWHGSLGSIEVGKGKSY